MAPPPFRLSRIIQEEMVISSLVLPNHSQNRSEKQLSIHLWNGDISTTRCLHEEDGNFHLEGWKKFKDTYSLVNGDILLFTCGSRGRFTLSLFKGESGAEITLIPKIGS
ncbi:hypothetical protein RYX36_030301 [Vicia faba]